MAPFVFTAVWWNFRNDYWLATSVSWTLSFALDHGWKFPTPCKRKFEQILFYDPLMWSRKIKNNVHLSSSMVDFAVWRSIGTSGPWNFFEKYTANFLFLRNIEVRMDRAQLQKKWTHKFAIFMTREPFVNSVFITTLWFAQFAQLISVHGVVHGSKDPECIPSSEEYICGYTDSVNRPDQFERIRESGTNDRDI